MHPLSYTWLRFKTASYVDALHGGMQNSPARRRIPKTVEACFFTRIPANSLNSSLLSQLPTVEATVNRLLTTVN